MYIRDQLAHLHRWLCGTLLSQEQKTEPQREQPHEWVVQVGLLLLHEDLQDGVRGILITGAHIDEPDGQTGDSLQGGRIVGVQDDRADALEKVSSCRASIGEGETEQSSNLQIGLATSFKLLNQNGLHGVHLISDATVDETQSHERTGYDMVLTTLHVLVNLCDTFVDIPK